MSSKITFPLLNSKPGARLINRELSDLLNVNKGRDTTPSLPWEGLSNLHFGFFLAVWPRMLECHECHGHFYFSPGVQRFYLGFMALYVHFTHLEPKLSDIRQGINVSCVFKGIIFVSGNGFCPEFFTERAIYLLVIIRLLNTTWPRNPTFSFGEAKNVLCFRLPDLPSFFFFFFPWP